MFFDKTDDSPTPLERKMIPEASRTRGDYKFAEMISPKPSIAV